MVSICGDGDGNGVAWLKRGVATQNRRGHRHRYRHTTHALTQTLMWTLILTETGRAGTDTDTDVQTGTDKYTAP